MRTNLQKWIGISCGVLLVIINCIALAMNIEYIPLISLGVVGLYLLIFKLDFLIYLMAFVVPLSTMFEERDINIGLSFPGEVFMVLIMGVFFIRLFIDLKLDKKIIKHPVTIAIFIYLGWILFTSFTSELPIVSFKFFLSKIWFITSCYFILFWFVKNDISKWVRFMNFYMASLSIVVVIATYRLQQAGFDAKDMHWIMSPFYNDHTAYGAAIAIFIPLQIGFLFLSKRSGLSKLLTLLFLCMLFIGLYFSYCRAAWVSLIGVFGVFVVLKLKIKMSWILAGVGLLALTLYSFSDEIIYTMERNTQDSSNKYVEKHIESISNISTDASNVERLNRWVSAFGMIEERPWLGWGPGTYQFVYAAYQKPQYKTIISTSFGDGGNAHSEYIGPTAESGFIGLATVLALMIAILYTGITTYIRARRKDIKIITLAATLALISYYLHGTLNNFLDTDKLSLPFWACVAIIVIMNLMYKEEQSNDTCNTPLR